MISYRVAYKNLEYFKNVGPNWSKVGSFVDKHHRLYVIITYLEHAWLIDRQSQLWI